MNGVRSASLVPDNVEQVTYDEGAVSRKVSATDNTTLDESSGLTGVQYEVGALKQKVAVPNRAQFDEARTARK
jgi:hypothetical protein